MSYTREQIEGMSDFEVNKALCLNLGYDVSGVTEERNYMTNAVSDFCHQWHLIMPLAVEYKISLATTDGGLTWWAAHDVRICENTFISCCALDYQHTSPQRAIACCLLMLDLGAKARGEV